MVRIARKSDGRRIFTAEFKREQIGRVLRGELTLADLSRGWGSHEGCCQRWKRLMTRGPRRGCGRRAPDTDEQSTDDPSTSASSSAGREAGVELESPARGVRRTEEGTAHAGGAPAVTGPAVGFRSSSASSPCCFGSFEAARCCGDPGPKEACKDEDPRCCARVLGIVGLVYGGIGYNRDRTILDLGGIKATPRSTRPFRSRLSPGRSRWPAASRFWWLRDSTAADVSAGPSVVDTLAIRAGVAPYSKSRGMT